MTEQTNHTAFEEAVLPPFPNLTYVPRWLIRNTQDAEDVVQEDILPCLPIISGGFRGGNARCSLSRLCATEATAGCIRTVHSNPPTLSDEQLHTDMAENKNPESLLLQKADGLLLKQALEELPAAFREVLVLLELEGLSYKEIAEVLGIPIGTVMSRLHRAGWASRIPGRHISTRNRSGNAELAMETIPSPAGPVIDWRDMFGGILACSFGV